MYGGQGRVCTRVYIYVWVFRRVCWHMCVPARGVVGMCVHVCMRVSDYVCACMRVCR